GDEMRLRLESLAVTQLSLFRDDEPLGSHPATGFLYRYGQSVALVSNWHVFTGVNPVSGNPLPGLCSPPNRVDFCINFCDPEKSAVNVRAETARLIDNQRCLWWQHKGYLDETGSTKIIDVGVLPLDGQIPDFEAIKA